MPFELQPFHLLMIFVVALLIFGPQRLPEIGRGIGRAINEFRRGTQEMTDSMRDEIGRTGQAASARGVTTEPLPARGNFCIQCGSPNPPAARFCNQCGASMPG